MPDRIPRHPQSSRGYLILCAGVALHGMLSNSTISAPDIGGVVTAAFEIAREFLRQAEQIK